MIIITIIKYELIIYQIFVLLKIVNFIYLKEIFIQTFFSKSNKNMSYLSTFPSWIRFALIVILYIIFFQIQSLI